jgi:DNA-binding MurR/RpiR family transcriptional regulator
MFHMTATDTPERSLDELSRRLAELVEQGTPAIAGFASWALEHPEEMAFHSVRGLAKLSGANVNTVYRLSLALGFPGFEECRRAFQAALRRRGGLYGARAARLSAQPEGARIERLRTAAQANLDALFAEDTVARIGEAAALLLRARRIHCIGVRSCFSLAHYFAYTGGMAFPHFERMPTEPGGIADRLAHAGEGEVVVLITFSLYSAEVIRAHRAARAKGLDVIAITDRYTSPIAGGARLVFCLPMEGPQPLPSQGAGFTLVEAIIDEMVASDPGAPARIAEFERQLLELGSYVAGGEA